MSFATQYQNLSTLAKMQDQYSDMYKDAYGIRPRINPSWTEDEYEVEFEFLQGIINDEEQDRLDREADAADAFERRVQELYTCGAKDREMALRWIHEAEGTDGDNDYLCYLLGLSYSYFKKETV